MKKSRLWLKPDDVGIIQRPLVKTNGNIFSLKQLSKEFELKEQFDVLNYRT